MDISESYIILAPIMVRFPPWDTFLLTFCNFCEKTGEV